MFITRKRYRDKMDETIKIGFITGKRYAGAKIYKEIMGGTTMSKIKNMCQDLMHNKETTNT